MQRLALIAAPLALLAANGCVVYADETPPPPHNLAPVVLDGAAWVEYDRQLGDDIWAFDAVVDDPDGYRDILGVWADVYDESRAGEHVESFELFPTDEPSYWYSDWFGSTTRLDPFNNAYTVDLVVYDLNEKLGWLTVWAETY
jgi:hypothetical protein